MPSIVYQGIDGSHTEIEVPVGTSVMQGAVSGGLSGIVAECGGSCMCATCHVYVHEDDLERVPPVSELEAAMLEDAAAERRTSSRLSCQIAVTPDMDGLRVILPETQI